MRIKVGSPYNHNSNPVERFHRTLWSLLKAQKANGENNWERQLPTLILAYKGTQHSSMLCSPVRIFLGRETDLPHLSLLPKFKNDSDPPPQPHTLEEDLDQILDLMRRSDAVCVRRQFRAYANPLEDIQVGDLCYAAVLPAVGNSRKLMLDWSGPVKVIEIINNALLK